MIGTNLVPPKNDNSAPAEEKTIGGIIIPDTAKEKPLKGEVIAVGNGTKDEEMVLKVGDTVLYGKYCLFHVILLLKNMFHSFSHVSCFLNLTIQVIIFIHHFSYYVNS